MFTCVGWQVTLCDPIWQVTVAVIGHISALYRTVDKIIASYNLDFSEQ